MRTSALRRELAIEALRKICRWATPGRRWYEDGDDSWDLYAAQDFDGIPVHPLKLLKAPKHNTPYAEYWPSDGDAQFLATFDQDTVAALLDAANALRLLLDETGVEDLCSGLSLTQHGCAGCPAHDGKRALDMLVNLVSAQP